MGFAWILEILYNDTFYQDLLGLVLVVAAGLFLAPYISETNFPLKADWIAFILLGCLQRRSLNQAMEKDLLERRSFLLSTTKVRMGLDLADLGFSSFTPNYVGSDPARILEI